jgi:hypothetical protein
LDIRTVVSAVALHVVVALAAVGHDHLNLASALLTCVLVVRILSALPVVVHEHDVALVDACIV